MRALFVMVWCNLAAMASAGEAPTVVPQCQAPAKIDGPWDERGAGYFIAFKGTTNFRDAAAALALRYHLVVQNYYLPLHAVLVADLPAATVAALRCEPSVDYISYNGVAHTT
jgi:putative salt-induced outer membrane protein YdiY